MSIIFKIGFNYKKGETIIKEGSHVSNILYILDGLVKIYLEGPKRNIIIKLLTPGDFIGLTSLSGMAIESVARILSKFKDEKIIALQGKKIKILNIELLKKISKNG